MSENEDGSGALTEHDCAQAFFLAFWALKLRGVSRPLTAKWVAMAVQHCGIAINAVGMDVHGLTECCMSLSALVSIAPEAKAILEQAPPGEMTGEVPS